MRLILELPDELYNDLMTIDEISKEKIADILLQEAKDYRNMFVDSEIKKLNFRKGIYHREDGDVECIIYKKSSIFGETYYSIMVDGVSRNVPENTVTEQNKYDGNFKK